MGFYGNMWTKTVSSDQWFDRTFVALENDLLFYDRMIANIGINESTVLLEANTTLNNIIAKIKEYWGKLKTWFKEKIKFVKTKVKELIQKLTNMGKDVKLDKTKNMDKSEENKDNSDSKDEEKEENIEGFYYYDCKLGISFLSLSITKIRAISIESSCTLSTDFSFSDYDKYKDKEDFYSKIDDLYNSTKEEFEKFKNENHAASEVKKKDYKIIIKPFSTNTDLERTMKNIIHESRDMTDLLKQIQSEYEKIDKQIEEFDKEINNCIKNIQNNQGSKDGKDFGSLNYYKQEVNKNKQKVKNDDLLLRQRLELSINNPGKLSNTDRIVIMNYEKKLGREIRTKDDIDEIMTKIVPNNRSSYNNYLLKNEYGKEGIEKQNFGIKVLSTELKILKDALNATKFIGSEAIQYTQELFGYCQHNKSEYTKLLAIYNSINKEEKSV